MSGLFLVVHYALPRLIVDTKSTQVVSYLNPILRENQHPVRFLSQENDTIAAILCEATVPQKGTVILLHGIRGRKEHFQELSQILAEKGYNSLAIDLRAHGQSGGQYCTYGYYEKYDIQSAVDYLGTQGLDSNIGVWGQSLGGAIALQALAIEPRLNFGIIESTFSDLSTIVNDYSERMFGFSIPSINRYALYRGGQLAQFRPSEVVPMHSAKNISQPILIAHGTEDKNISFSYGQQNFDSLASSYKTFIPVEGALHHNLWSVGGSSYFDRVFNFLSSLPHK